MAQKGPRIPQVNDRSGWRSGQPASSYLYHYWVCKHTMIPTGVKPNLTLISTGTKLNMTVSGHNTWPSWHLQIFDTAGRVKSFTSHLDALHPGGQGAVSFLYPCCTEEVQSLDNLKAPAATRNLSYHHLSISKSQFKRHTNSKEYYDVASRVNVWMWIGCLIFYVEKT